MRIPVDRGQYPVASRPLQTLNKALHYALNKDPLQKVGMWEFVQRLPRGWTRRRVDARDERPGPSTGRRVPHHSHEQQGA